MSKKKKPGKLGIDWYSQPFSFPTDLLVQFQAPFSSLPIVQTLTL